MFEKVQRSFTRLIPGMAGLSYTERLTVLKLYSLQRRRERYIIIYVWKIFQGLVPNLFPPICTKTSDRRGRTALDGVPSVCLTNCLCLCVIPLYLLFIVSRNNWIATYLQCLILGTRCSQTTQCNQSKFVLSCARMRRVRLGSLSSELLMCGGGVHSILLLLLVARCIQTIDVCI